MKHVLALAALMLLAPSVVQAACTVSALDVAFGNYDPFSTVATDFNGRITVTCSANSGTSSIVLALSVGSTGGGATYGERDMGQASTVLGYNLYQDAAHSVVWGDGTGGSQVVTGNNSVSVNGGSVSFTVYGRIRRGQQRYNMPGRYTDNIVVTLTY